MYAQILSFLSTKTSSSDAEVVQALSWMLSQEEWDAKLVCKELMEKLYLKGSPKLSKVLLGLGVPKKSVDLALGGNKNNASSTASMVVGHWEDHKDLLWEQGNSCYYSSCQATDGRAAWGGSSEYVVIETEEEYWGSSLFMWVVGEPMSVDGRGWRARAKLRVLYGEYDEIAGLYVDRPYGESSLLLTDINYLQSWWQDWSHTNTPILMPPVWKRDNGAGSDFEDQYGGIYTPLYCPSANGGYQDTMAGCHRTYSFFVNISENLLTKAYKNRPKEGSVYLTAIQVVEYNSQGNNLIFPKVAKREPRKQLSDASKKAAEQFFNLFGRPESKFEQFYSGCINTTYMGERVCWAYNKLEFMDRHVTPLQAIRDGLEVIDDLPGLGFKTACPLNWEYTQKDCLEVLRPQEGSEMLKAEILPYEYKANTLRVKYSRWSFEVADEMAIMRLEPFREQDYTIVVRDELEFGIAKPKSIEYASPFQYRRGRERIMDVAYNVKGYCHKAVSIESDGPVYEVRDTLIVREGFTEWGYAKAMSIHEHTDKLEEVRIAQSRNDHRRFLGIDYEELEAEWGFDL